MEAGIVSCRQGGRLKQSEKQTAKADNVLLVSN
jgi:hypothetical protein